MGTVSSYQGLQVLQGRLPVFNAESLVSNSTRFADVMRFIKLQSGR